jgi:hypothetical protein
VLIECGAASGCFEAVLRVCVSGTRCQRWRLKIPCVFPLGRGNAVKLGTKHVLAAEKSPRQRPSTLDPVLVSWPCKPPGMLSLRHPSIDGFGSAFGYVGILECRFRQTSAKTISKVMTRTSGNKNFPADRTSRSPDIVGLAKRYRHPHRCDADARHSRLTVSMCAVAANLPLSYDNAPPTNQL